MIDPDRFPLSGGLLRASQTSVAGVVPIPREPAPPVRKATSETVNNSATLQDDDELFFAVDPYEVWMWRAVVFYTSSATADLKVAWTVPTGATLYHAGMGLDTALAVSGPTVVAVSGTATAYGGNGATVLAYTADGYIANGATLGKVQFQWAQNSAEVSDTIVLTPSFILPVRLY